MGTIGAARYAGSRVARVEDARLLTGEGTFVDDISRPGMLHACFVRSPVARARIAAHRRVRGPRGRRRARRVPRRRPEPGCGRAVAHVDRARRPRDAPPAARRGRGAVRGRPRGPRGGRQPLRRRGRGRAGRRRLRRPHPRRRLRRGRGRRRRGPRPPPEQRHRQDVRPAAREGRGRVRLGGPRGRREARAARLRGRADRDPGHGRRVVRRRRRGAHDLGRDRRCPTRCASSAPGCSVSPSTASG